MTAIAAGDNHTVALKQDGSVACWGNNDFGQCNVPAGLGTVTAIAAGGYHTVALLAPPVASPCPADLDGDGIVSSSDLPPLLNAWGTVGKSPADINGDGEVDVADLSILLDAWGPCPR